MSLIKAGDILNFSKYYSVPKEVVNMLSSDVVNIKSNDIVVYMLLLDRLKLSLSNHERFSNDEGEKYVVYEQKELMAITGLSNRGLIDCMKRLEDAGIIKVERQGRMLPNLYFFYNLFDTTEVTLQNLTHDFTNSHHSYNNYIYNDSERYITLTSDDGNISQDMAVYDSFYLEYKYPNNHPKVKRNELIELSNVLEDIKSELNIDRELMIQLMEYHFKNLSEKNNGHVKAFIGNKGNSPLYRYINNI